MRKCVLENYIHAIRFGVVFAAISVDNIIIKCHRLQHFGRQAAKKCVDTHQVIKIKLILPLPIPWHCVLSSQISCYAHFRQTHTTTIEVQRERERERARKTNNMIIRLNASWLNPIYEQNKMANGKIIVTRTEERIMFVIINICNNTATETGYATQMADYTLQTRVSTNRIGMDWIAEYMRE